MNAILVISPNWLGDAVFSSFALHLLREKYPQAKIVCLCHPRVADIISRIEAVDELIIDSRQQKGFILLNWWKLYQKIRAVAFDAVFMLQHSGATGWLLRLAQIPLRIGYCKWPKLLTHPIVKPQAACHRAGVYAHVVTAFFEGWQSKINLACVLKLTVGDQDEGDAWLKQNQLLNQAYVVCHMGGNWDLKRWSIENWAALFKIISQRRNLPIVLTGGQQDIILGKQIQCDKEVSLINAIGKTTLGQSLRIFQQAQCVISADSGPLHLAHGVGASVVAIFGPTRPEITGPLGLGKKRIVFHDVGCNKRACYFEKCEAHECMKSIRVDDVWQAIESVTS